MHAMETDDLADHEVVRRAQRRVMVGSLVTILGSLSLLLAPVGMAGSAVAIGIMMWNASSGLSGPAGTQAMVSVFLAAFGLLACIPPIGLIIGSAMSWRLRSEQTPLVTGIAAIVISMLYLALAMCGLGVFGCLVAPVQIGLGITGGILLILSSQHPDVAKAIAHRARWKAEDHQIEI